MAEESFTKGFGQLGAYFYYRVKRCLYLALENFAGHVHAFLLHLLVGLVHGGHVTDDFSVQLFVVDLDSLLEFAVIFILLQILDFGQVSGLVVQGYFPTIHQPESETGDTLLFALPIVQCYALHKCYNS